MFSGFRSERHTKWNPAHSSFSFTQLAAECSDPVHFMARMIEVWIELSPSELDVNLMMLHISLDTLITGCVTSEDREVVVRFSCLACASSRAARDFILDCVVRTHNGLDTAYSRIPDDQMTMLLAACAVHILSKGQLEDILDLLSDVDPPIPDKVRALCYASKSLHNADLQQVLRIQKEIEMIVWTVCKCDVPIATSLADDIAETGENIGRRIRRLHARRHLVGDIWQEFLTRYKLLSRLPNITGHRCLIPYTELSFKDKIK